MTAFKKGDTVMYGQTLCVVTSVAKNGCFGYNDYLTHLVDFFSNTKYIRSSWGHYNSPIRLATDQDVIKYLDDELRQELTDTDVDDDHTIHFTNAGNITIGCQRFSYDRFKHLLNTVNHKYKKLFGKSLIDE